MKTPTARSPSTRVCGCKPTGSFEEGPTGEIPTTVSFPSANHTLTGLILLFSGFVSVAEPSPYDECILKSMKGVKSDRAAALIAQACRKSIKSKNKKAVRSLAIEELNRLTGGASFDTSSRVRFLDDFSVRIHNGNASVTVSSITFQITMTQNGKQHTNPYREDVDIKPLTAKAYKFGIMAGNASDTPSWSIASARGYSTPANWE